MREEGGALLRRKATSFAKKGALPLSLQTHSGFRGVVVDAERPRGMVLAVVS